MSPNEHSNLDAQSPGPGVARPYFKQSYRSFLVSLSFADWVSGLGDGALSSRTDETIYAARTTFAAKTAAIAAYVVFPEKVPGHQSRTLSTNRKQAYAAIPAQRYL